MITVSLSKYPNFERDFGRAFKAAYNELLNGALQVLDDSQILVPVDTGALKQSGEIIYEKDAIIIRYGDDAIGAGGKPSRVYAWDQHENLTYAHVNGGQAKYLEEPFVKRWNEIQQQTIDAFMRKL